MAKIGVMIAGLSSSSGKTFITLGLLKALSKRGDDVAGAKTGPDYIDPGFHQAACGVPSVNLDGFAMSKNLIRHLAGMQAGKTLIVEGVMGLYDGGEGSAVALARHLGIPLVLAIDIRGMAETTGEIAAALKTRLHDQDLTLGGVILNRSQSERHGEIARQSCVQHGVDVVGIIPELPKLDMPSRHLGLVQAADLMTGQEGQAGQLKAILDQGAEAISAGVDLNRLMQIASPLTKPSSSPEAIPPLGQRIAIAHDAAFGFSYTHLLEGWRRLGAEILPFSPLADEAPRPDADFIFLPGGYPELHLDTLAAANTFKSALQKAVKNIPIYGECGGYMVLGHEIRDHNNTLYPMLGLLDLATSFYTPKRVLGYRRLEVLPPAPFNLPAHAFGHEFHFTQALHEEGEKLFKAQDKDGNFLGEIGLKSGHVAGSYAHLIA